ncbi:MAG: hypothetical protein WKG07_32165 [Hymenobacter sp.]
MLLFPDVPDLYLLPHRVAGLFLLLSLLAASIASAQDSTLTRLIRQNQYALTPQGSQFSGPGWDKLRASIQKSQFVLIGEDHGTAQIPHSPPPLRGI